MSFRRHLNESPPLPVLDCSIHPALKVAGVFMLLLSCAVVNCEPWIHPPFILQTGIVFRQQKRLLVFFII
jgi:hypothetical protein